MSDQKIIDLMEEAIEKAQLLVTEIYSLTDNNKIRNKLSEISKILDMEDYNDEMIFKVNDLVWVRLSPVFPSFAGKILKIPGCGNEMLVSLITGPKKFNEIRLVNSNCITHRQIDK